MKNIREQVEHLLWNYDIKDRLSLQGEGAEAFVDDLLALFPKIKTEEEVLKNFEDLGYKIVINNENILKMIDNAKNDYFVVYKNTKDFYKVTVMDNRERIEEITIQEHKLLNELFDCWGWI